MAKQIGGTKAIEPSEPSTQRPADGFIESGWSHYSKKEYSGAEEDFRKAYEIEPDNADTLYALAMSQQADGRQEQAIRTFEKTIEQLEARKAEDPVRFLMLTRLAHGHINRMKTGDWMLSK
jgi:tetratricopeptide (TPR) repeat protein